MKNFHKTRSSRDVDPVYNDSTAMIEDMECASSPLSEARERMSVSPEADMSYAVLGTKDIKQHKILKVEHEAALDSRVSSPEEGDE